MNRVLVLLGLLCAASAAWADPFSAVAALSTFAGAAGVGASIGFTAATWFYIGVAASVLGAVNGRRKARKAQATARAEANAALQDRTATVLRTDPPWQVVYGRCIVGGFYADIITTDKMVISEAAEVGVEIAKPDAYKTNVIVMTAHEVEDIHEVFIDGVPVGPVDEDGWAAVGSSATVTFTASTNIVTWTATPAANGHAITFGGGTLPTGLTAGLVYFVREKTTNGFKLATTPNGPAVDFTTDGSGTITGTLRSPFFAQETGARILVFTDEVTFDEGPLVAVFSAYTGTGQSQEPVVVTIESGNRLVSAVPDVEVTVNFSFTRDAPTVRIGKFYGADDQTTPAYLNEIAPTRWTSDHRLRGCAGVVVTLDLEDVRFQGGPPQITADISGRLVHDPRDDSTAFSPNAALCTRDFLAAPWGFEVDIDDDIDTTVASASADVCDEAIDLVVGSVTEEDQPRYTVNGSFQTDGSREAVLADLVDAMGGAVSYGAKYRILAGAWTEPVMSLTDDDLHGQIEVVQADTPTSELFNGIRGQLFLAGAQSPSDFNPYQNATFAADDGRDLWTNTTLPFTNHLARARNLSRIAVEQTRSGQVIRYPAKMKAWPLEIGDRVTVTSAEYGLSAKAYRVTDWQFDVSSAVILTLQEDAEEIYDLADAAVADPTPNTGLADPWAVPQVQNVEAFSGGTTLLIQADGTIVPRVAVTWDPVANGSVTAGGRIEVLWRSQSATAWIYGYVKGADTAAYLYGAEEGDTIIIEVRARSARGRAGPSTFVAHLVVGKTAPPSDVENLDWEIKPSLVRITCDPCPDVDYAETELRYMDVEPDYDSGDWDAATFLVSGKSNEYHHPRPPNGTYYVLAKHKDTSGNYSANPAYITVVVDDSIDGGIAGTLRLSSDRFPFFSFANGTTHTAQAPGDTTITFTARLQGVVGTATFTAEAFDSGGGSLGTFTLGGTGNARTMTAAQFVSLGTSGSVRSVVVEATIGSASDSLTVFRQDSTTTTPRIYLSNPVASVPTDEAGEFGDYSDATTQVQVFAGLSDDTDDYTFSITPDSGVTATINGGAGPVSGTASVTVAVTDSTIDDAAVLIGATGPATLSATFRVLKNEATGPGYTAFFTPAEIRLPALSSGAVASYADASSVFVIQKGGIDDTAQWTLAKEDENVDSTLTGALIEVTDFHDLGETASGTSVAMTLATGWDRPQSLVWAGTAWLTLGYHASTGFSHILRSTDFVTWGSVNVGTAGQWQFGAYGAGRVILPAWDSVTDDYITSTDGGATWSAVQSFGASAQWSCITYGNGRWIVGALGTTAGRTSTDGTTWSGVTLPAVPYEMYHAGPGWFLKDGSDAWRFSVSGTSSWSSSISALTGVSHIRGVAGRAVGFLSGTSAVYSEDGATWVTVTLPESYTVEYTQIIRGVLYLVGTDGKVQYTTDGIKWVYAGGSAGNTVSYIAMRALGTDLQTNALHSINTSGSYVHNETPLLSTSADTGFVTITATKPNEADIVRTLPVRKGVGSQDVYTSYAQPAMLLLPATSDGVVTSYSTATITAKINKNGVDDTANWTWAYTTTYLTPSSGSSNVVTVTAMDNAQDQGTISFTATKAGQPVITGTLLVNKIKGTVPSGPLIGAAFNAITATNTFIGVKFLGDGRFQTKVGSGGTYTDAGQWHSVVQSGNASTYWIRVEATGHALNSGTTGTWLAMTSDREYTLSDASSGTHRTDLQVLFATSSGGANALMGYGALQLIVP